MQSRVPEDHDTVLIPLRNRVKLDLKGGIMSSYKKGNRGSKYLLSSLADARTLRPFSIYL